MNILSKVGQGAKDFGHGLHVIFGKPKQGEGDRRLAKVATIVESQISVYGKQAVRMQVIKSIEHDMGKAAKKGNVAVDSLVQTAFDTPEYMHMLQSLGIGESHIRVLAMQAVKIQQNKKEARVNGKK